MDVADKLAKYFNGHLASLWQNFSCNFMGSLKITRDVSRHLVAFFIAVWLFFNDFYSVGFSVR